MMRIKRKLDLNTPIFNGAKKHYKRLSLLVVLTGFLLTMYTGCKKSDVGEQNTTDTEQAIKSKLQAAGFDVSDGLHPFKNGYLVEGDIFFTVNDINNLDIKSKVKIPLNSEVGSLGGQSKVNDKISHYRTNDFLTLYTSRRTIQIYMGSSFGTYMQNSLDSVIARYNALDLSLIFSRTTNPSTADITILTSYNDPASYPDSDHLMMAGFPSSGNPYNQIYVNTYYYNSSYNRLDAITSLAHEIGHCIGFRHSDYMNRAFSCGIVKSNNNEGSSGGAVHLPGTTSSEATNSWMLSCSNSYDRPFTTEDILALKIMYSYVHNIYVKQVYTLIYDDSYYTTYNDYDKRSYNINLEFYQDAAGTIPYTTSNYFMLRLSYMWAGSDTPTNILLANGLTSYNLGDVVIDREYVYGDLVYDNSSGYSVLDVAPYQFLPFN